MSDHVSTAFQQALLNLDDDDWVGRAVLNREAALLGLADWGRQQEKATVLQSHSALQPEGSKALLQQAHHGGLNPLAVQDASGASSSFAFTGQRFMGVNTGLASASQQVKPDPPAKSDARLSSLRCSVIDCSHKGGFLRQFELDRHVWNKHTGGRSYTCPAPGCFRGPSPPTFARLDKLTSHIKSCHKCDIIFDCPVDACPLGTGLALETMGIHIRRVHPRDESEARAIANATSFSFRKCPVWSCGKHFPSSKYQAHMAGHNIEELHNALTAIQDQGYCIIMNDGILSENSQPILNDKFKTVVQPQCPVCRTVCINQEAFKHHFWATHLFKDPVNGPGHFQAWKDAIESITDSWGSSRRTIRTREPWQLFEFAIAARAREVSCPVCDFQATRKSYIALEPDGQHHLSLLRPVDELIAELRPYRMQIVRLYPAFETHPIFDDFYGMPDLQGSVEEIDDTTMADA